MEWRFAPEEPRVEQDSTAEVDPISRGAKNGVVDARCGHREPWFFRLFHVARVLPCTCEVLDSTLVSAVALVLGSLACRDPGACVATGIALLVLLWPKLGRRHIVFALALFAVGALRATESFEVFARDWTQARDALGSPARCVGRLQIVGSPTRRGSRLAFYATSAAMQCDGNAAIHAGTRLRLYAVGDDLTRGDVIHATVTVGGVEVARNHEADSAYAHAARMGAALSGSARNIELLQRPRLSLPSWIDRARRHARRRIEATYHGNAAPLARALVLGENDLPPEDTNAFRLSGLSHLLAVSGAHIVVCVLGIVNLMMGLLRRIERLAARFDVARLASAFGIGLAWMYADFAGGGGSVRRAALMTSATLGARVLCRHPDSARAFGLSLLAGGLFDPLAPYDISFGLSAAATAGLMVLGRPLQARLNTLPSLLRWVTPPLSATLSATLFCTPWLMVLGPEISVVGVFANVVAVPLGEAISLPASLCHLLLAPIPVAERGMAHLASGSLMAVRAIAHFGASCTWLAVPTPRPTPLQLGTVAVLGAAMAIRRPRDRLLTIALGSILLIALEAAAVRAEQPRNRLRVTFLDVGQGDSTLVDLPGGRTMLVDGGGGQRGSSDPGSRILAPILRSRRRSRIDFVVLSHPHADHYGGLGSAVRRLSVGQFWDPAQQKSVEHEPGYRALVAEMARRQVPILKPSQLCQRRLMLFGAEIRTLAPCPDLDSGRSVNDNSYVIHIRYGRRSVLLTGDAGAALETQLVRDVPEWLRADVLKVGHHGSDTSSTAAFLDHVRPNLAVISCGVRNRHGHPAQTTMDAFQERGVRVLRTDRVGAVKWETDGTESEVRVVNEEGL